MLTAFTTADESVPQSEQQGCKWLGDRTSLGEKAGRSRE